MASPSRGTVNILFNIPNFITAGSGLALVEVIRRLNRDRFAPAVCVLKSGGKLEATIQELGIPLYEHPFTVAPRPIATLPMRIWRASRRFRPYHFTIWHSYHYSDDYTEPLMARAAGARAWVYTKKNMGWGSRAWQLRTLLASRIAAQNTTMLERFFAAPRHLAKTRLVPPGVDAEKFRPDVPPRLALRQRFSLATTTCVVGCVANLLPIKGQNFLIQAIAQVPQAVLLLAGRALDETYVAGLRRLCAELHAEDRVCFLDDVHDVPAFNAELDVFAFPSLAKGEGCPVALLEALACGLPCIATHVPGSKDLITDGENGLLVSPENVQALAAAIRQLQASPQQRHTFGSAARRSILACHTIDHEVAALEALYGELLKDN
ncbi:MAG: glycosyltransferase [Anaerolineae bacterium]|nr:glycosyltransferase [Anaerolineae bacterium]